MPLILFGDGKFANNKKQRSGNYSWLKKYLAISFLVIIVNEYNTSQKCPKCLRQLEDFDYTVRIKKCRHCKSLDGLHDFVVNKDVSAPMNMLTATVCLIFRGQRPVELRPPDKKKEEPDKEQEAVEEEMEDRGASSSSAKGRKSKVARGPEGSNVRRSERKRRRVVPVSDKLENTGG